MNKLSIKGKLVVAMVAILAVLLLFRIFTNRAKTTDVGMLDWGILPRYEIEGDESQGIRPGVVFGMNHDNWNVEIEFTPLTNFSSGTWFIPVNSFNARLALWATNGTELSLRRSARQAMQLPERSTVSNLLRTVDLSRRGMNFPPGEVGGGFQSAQFPLSAAFGVKFDQDLILEVKAVLYRPLPKQQHVEFTRQIVQLVEFPPIRVKLKRNGDVEVLK